MTNNYNRLINNLHELKLNEFREQLPHFLSLVSKGEMDVIDAMYQLTELEKSKRTERMISACVRTAGFPFLKELKDYDFSFQPDIDKGVILDLGTLKFIEENKNVLFCGTSGTGKTHLSVSIGIEAAKHHYSTYFITCQALMAQLKQAEHENRLEAKLKHYAKYRLLIIDEIGYLNLDASAANLMFQLISRRYEKKSTIITTNKAFSGWGELFGDPVTANAILDRLLHHCHVIKMNGPSYRTKDIFGLQENYEE